MRKNEASLITLKPSKLHLILPIKPIKKPHIAGVWFIKKSDKVT